MQPGDVDLESLVTNRPGQRPAPSGRSVGEGGELQSRTNRLDPEPVPISVNKRDHLLKAVESSPKKAEVVLRISLTPRNSRFSDFRTRRRRRSSIVSPA